MKHQLVANVKEEHGILGSQFSGYILGMEKKIMSVCQSNYFTMDQDQHL